MNAIGESRRGLAVAGDDQVTPYLIGYVIDVVELEPADIVAVHPWGRRWSGNADTHLVSAKDPRKIVARNNVPRAPAEL